MEPRSKDYNEVIYAEQWRLDGLFQWRRIWQDSYDCHNIYKFYGCSGGIYANILAHLPCGGQLYLPKFYGTKRYLSQSSWFASQLQECCSKGKTRPTLLQICHESLHIRPYTSSVCQSLPFARDNGTDRRGIRLQCQHILSRSIGNNQTNCQLFQPSIRIYGFQNRRRQCWQQSSNSFTAFSG